MHGVMGRRAPWGWGIFPSAGSGHLRLEAPLGNVCLARPPGWRAQDYDKERVWFSLSRVTGALGLVTADSLSSTSLLKERSKDEAFKMWAGPLSEAKW